MASPALNNWQQERRNRLDSLVDARGLLEKSVSEERWHTEALDGALILYLAAEFQGFARDLHDRASDIFAAWTVPTDTTVQGVVRSQLVQGRELDRGNARPESIDSDFGRFGMDLWAELLHRDAQAAEQRQSLALLNEARNGLAHSDLARLAVLRDKGHPLTLDTFRNWRKDLDALAANLDSVVTGSLARLFKRQRPW